ncbi:POM121-like protein 2 [Callorhinus ursinus]|uniref:POM121-like protein 12 n=1 Tax=Callorhinus ursinus TaxID=34884 RepID=A0A3Q7N121_CALUR|nr:POM121-like protein 12 [Callorhinus ursinus]
MCCPRALIPTVALRPASSASADTWGTCEGRISPSKAPTPPHREHGQLPGQSQGHAATPLLEAPVPAAQASPPPSGPGSEPSHLHPRGALDREPAPPHLDHPRVQRAIVPKAWRRFHSKSPLHTFLGLDFSSNRESFMKQWLGKAQNLLSICNMVTIKITPPERSGSFSRGPPIPEQLDCCAKETRLRARSPCRKRKRIHRPLQFEATPTKRRRPSPGARPSAFKPVWKDGVVPSFVPRPGPLRRGLCSWHPGDGADAHPGPDLLPDHRRVPGLD